MQHSNFLNKFKIAIGLSIFTVLTSCTGTYYPFSSNFYSSGNSRASFASTGSPRWAYDPSVYLYFDNHRNCYYDQELGGYYPVGYRPPYYSGLHHPSGWNARTRYCPPPSRITTKILSNYRYRENISPQPQNYNLQRSNVPQQTPMNNLFSANQENNPNNYKQQSRKYNSNRSIFHQNRNQNSGNSQPDISTTQNVPQDLQPQPLQPQACPNIDNNNNAQRSSRYQRKNNHNSSDFKRNRANNVNSPSPVNNIPQNAGNIQENTQRPHHNRHAENKANENSQESNKH